MFPKHRNWPSSDGSGYSSRLPLKNAQGVIRRDFHDMDSSRADRPRSREDTEEQQTRERNDCQHCNFSLSRTENIN
jgi:hypothetical protein